MSLSNEKNTLDIDVTVQLMNERVAFQYGSIINTTNGQDLLQAALDENLQSTDTQVEITVDLNEMYSASATVESVKSFQEDSYTLILPNRKSLPSGQEGFLTFTDSPSYGEDTKEYTDRDMYGQNTRSRYPKHTLKGAFKTIQQIKDLLGITALENRMSKVEDNITTLKTNVYNIQTSIIDKIFPSLQEHHYYIRYLWDSIYMNSFDSNDTTCYNKHGPEIVPPAFTA